MIDKEQTTLTLRPEQIREVEKIAQKEDRNKSNMFRILIDLGIKEYNKK